MTPEKTWVGIDVCKDVLNVYVLPQGLTLQQPNTEIGAQTLIQQL
jgi:transposase